MLQQLGRVSLISKPFTNEELSQAVHQSMHPDWQPPLPGTPNKVE
jgi:hypothetical protein